MKNEKDIFENINDFLSGNIKVRTFWIRNKEMRKKPFKPWKTELWKKNRKNKIKQCCEKCGSTERLTIQHTWHPKTFKKYLSETKRNLGYSKEYKKHLGEYPKDQLFQEQIVKKKHCTVCNNSDIHLGFKSRSYFCRNKRCKNNKSGFSQPKIVEHKVSVKITDKYHIDKYNRYKDEFFLTRATEKWIKGMYRYVDMRDEDHYTACRDCAYKEDLDNGLIEKARKRDEIRKNHSTKKLEHKRIRRRLGPNSKQKTFSLDKR